MKHEIELNLFFFCIDIEDIATCKGIFIFSLLFLSRRIRTLDNIARMDYSLISGVQQTLIVPPADENASTKLIHRDFHIKFHGAHVSYHYSIIVNL